MAEIGEPQREVTFEPLPTTVPLVEPAPEPVVEPQPVEVPA